MEDLWITSLAGLLEVSGGPVDYKPGRFTGGQWRTSGLQAWKVYWRSVEDLWITSLAGLLEVSGGPVITSLAGLFEVIGGPVDYKPGWFTGGQWRTCGLQAWQVYWRSVEDLWITSLAGLLEVSGGPVDYKPGRFIRGHWRTC